MWLITTSRYVCMTISLGNLNDGITVFHARDTYGLEVQKNRPTVENMVVGQIIFSHKLLLSNGVSQ